MDWQASVCFLLHMSFSRSVSTHGDGGKGGLSKCIDDLAEGVAEPDDLGEGVVVDQ